MIGSKKSENSSRKLMIVTGLVLKVSWTIYCEKSESRFGRDEIVGKFKRRSRTKIRVCKKPTKNRLFFQSRFLFSKCQISSFSCSNV